MKSPSPYLLSIALALCLTSAAAAHSYSFSVSPYGASGQNSSPTRITKQEGDNIGDKITRETFKEVTIAQGSGRYGFDAIRIFSDGTAYVVFGRDDAYNSKVDLQLSESQLDDLINTLNRDNISKIKGCYSAGWVGGWQGFIEVKTSKGRVYCWLDNYFRPITNTVDFCNQIIWLRAKKAPITESNLNRQVEYERIFPEKESDKATPATPPAAKTTTTPKPDPR